MRGSRQTKVETRDCLPRHALKAIGTAFGTARLIEFVLSADDAWLFRLVGLVHHRASRAWLITARNYPERAPSPNS